MRLKYMPSLDGIRAFAFAMVFVAHAGLDNAVPGGLGVTIFFFLSGYLITTLLRVEWSNTGDISLSGFYKRRAIRILPPLYLVMALAWILDWFHIPTHYANGYGLLSIVFYFYNYAVLTHPIAPNMIPEGLGVVWSLMIEEHFYLVFPFVFLLVRRRNLSRRFFVMLLAGGCVADLFWRYVLVYHFHTSLTSQFSWTYGATDARFDSILWGCILAIGINPWCGDTHPFLDAHRGRLALGGGALILCSLLIREPHFRETLRYSLQGMALLPIFYFVVSKPDNWECRWLQWKPIRWLGWVSYSMYLTHNIALHILHAYLTWNPVLVGACAAIISGLCSEAIRRWIEIPMRNMKNKAHLEVAVNI